MSSADAASFLESVRRHFVALSGSYREVDEAGLCFGSPKAFAFSGFVIAIRGVWCLMTAGHVIEKINGVLAHPRLRLVGCRLMDYFSVSAKVKDPIPFSYETEHIIHINRHGVDFGMIPLRPFYQTALEANGVVPLPTAGWQGYTIPKCEEYGLIGIPEENSESVEETEYASAGLKVQLVYVPLEAHAGPSIDSESKIPRFAAYLLDGGQLRSPVGMSGGPIVGIRKSEDGDWEYACIAIQSSWNPTTRTVFGTPAGIIVHTTEQLLEDAVSNGPKW